MNAAKFDAAAVRDTNLERQKLRLASLCLAGDAEARTIANNLLHGQNGRALADKLMTNATLLAMAIANGFDIGAPYGGRDKFLLRLITTSGKPALEQVETLLAAGWPVDLASEEDGTTALMLAAARYTAANRERVACLMQHGANPELKNNDGQSVFDQAPVAMRQYIEELLEKRAAQNKHPDTGSEHG